MLNKLLLWPEDKERNSFKTNCMKQEFQNIIKIIYKQIKETNYYMQKVMQHLIMEVIAPSIH